MRRLRRWIANAFIALSLLLCIASGVMWVRSCIWAESVALMGHPEGWTWSFEDARQMFRLRARHAFYALPDDLPRGYLHERTLPQSLEIRPSDYVALHGGRRLKIWTFILVLAEGDRSPLTREDLQSYRDLVARIEELIVERRARDKPIEDQYFRDVRNVKIAMLYARNWTTSFSFPAWFAVVLTALAPAFRMRSIWKRRGDRNAGLCPNCRYNLTANVSGVCPECGTPVGQGGAQEIARGVQSVARDV